MDDGWMDGWMNRQTDGLLYLNESEANFTVCICRVNYRRAEETPQEPGLNTSHTQQVRHFWSDIY